MGLPRLGLVPFDTANEGGTQEVEKTTLKIDTYLKRPDWS